MAKTRRRPSRTVARQARATQPTPTRERLLEAALTLFAEQGYRATTIDQIETAAGLTPRAGALYNHFPSKLALLEAVLEERTRAIEEFGERLDLAAPLGDLRAELILVARWGLAELERERLLLQLVLREGERVPELAQRFREAIVERALELAAKLIGDSARGRGLELKDPEALAELARSGLVGYSLQQLLFGEAFSEVDRERFAVAWAEGLKAAVEAGTTECTSATRSPSGGPG
jgi:AcrR family transcriptional regulator